MAIQDGQRVRAQESNSAWASKTVNNTMVGVQSLQNISSGPGVSNVQQEINDIKQDVSVNANEISNLQTDKQDLAEKSQPNGYASLDGLGKIPLSEIPDEIVGAMKFQGLWDASTNTPTLADGVGSPGDTFQTNIAGSVDFGSGSIGFTVGDFVIYNGTVWQKLEGGLVESVNGQVGVVNLDIGDLNDVDLSTPPTDSQGLIFDDNTSTWLPGSLAKFKTEYRTISSGEITAKELILTQTPSNPSEVLLSVKGGILQFLGDDFTVSGNILSWASLGLDGLLISGDKVIIFYAH